MLTIDRKIKQIAANNIITNKVRSPVNENLRIHSDNVNLRGNEAIRADMRHFNATANTVMLVKTSDDGSIRIKARRIFFGNQWKPLPVSSSPALTASVDAYRVCMCSTVRPKLFLVEGNKPCNAPPEICQ